ncbi:MAG: radical SAM protein [Clostridiales bacterium]|nr:radical SAM protein [Clostridiales bacterium]
MSIYFFEKNDKCVVFQSQTLKAWLADYGTKSILKAIMAGRAKEDVCGSFAISTERYNQLLSIANPGPEPEHPNDNSLSSLILHVSNTCNLACAYCYAHGGSYRSKASVMDVATVRKAIDAFFDQYSEIREVKFFGGEPFMNTDVIAEACRYIAAKKVRNEISRVPRYKVITNGTILPDSGLKAVRDYGIDVVLSVDGPEKVHDACRVYKGSSFGTFNDILKTANRLRESTNGSQPCGIEATYTAEHERAPISVHETVKYLSETFRVNPEKVNISPVIAEKGSPFNLNDLVSSFSLSVTDGIREQNLGNGCYSSQKINAYVRRLKLGLPAGSKICHAGSDWLAVSANGDVYPCYMFMDEKAFCMGNVHDAMFPSEQFHRLSSDFANAGNTRDQTCGSCCYKNLCASCMGMNYRENGDPFKMSSIQCRFNKSLLPPLIAEEAQEMLQMEECL